MLELRARQRTAFLLAEDENGLRQSTQRRKTAWLSRLASDDRIMANSRTFLILVSASGVHSEEGNLHE
jgi:hypothetical protein